MAIRHELRLLTPGNDLVAIIPDVYALTLTRSVNQTSTLTVSLPERWAVLINNRWRLELWRQVDDNAAYLETETQWVVFRRTQRTDSSGRTVCDVEAFSANGLLRDRVVLYYADAPQSRKAGGVDDIMHAVFAENYLLPDYTYTGTLSTGSPTVTAMSSQVGLYIGMAVTGTGIPADTRVQAIPTATTLTLSNNATATGSQSLTFAVQPIADRAPGGFANGTAPGATTETTKRFAYKQVSVVCDELAATARQAGEFVAYDLVRNAGALEFRTYVGQRGTDRTTSLLPLSVENGTLANPTLTDDWSDTVSVLVAAGQGEQDSRARLIVADVGRASAHALAWREQFYDGRNQVEINDLYNEAQARLAQGRKRVQFKAEILSVTGNEYGVDWFWGDLVQASYAGRSFVAHILMIELRLEQGNETVRAWIEEDAI